MKPEEQLRLLAKIWGRKRIGYVFLPYIDAAKARSKVRKQSWQEGRGYHWPREREAVLNHLRKHVDDDLYFAPALFEKPERKAEGALIMGRLWADLDEVDPRTIEEELKPTHAWQTSPGRYAAIWEMYGFRNETTEAGMENHKLTDYLGADPSGWDTTQLLRVPGSVNNKAEVIKRNEGEAPRGEIVWTDRERHHWDKFEELPEVTVARTVDVDSLSEELLESVDRHDVWGRVRLRVSSTVRGYMRLRDTEGLDRSEVAWQIECDLAAAGCSLAEIVAIIRPTIWNKFEGRQDELKRLMNEAAKAIGKNKDEHDDSLEPDDDGVVKPDLVPWQQDEAYLNAPEPEWLIEGLVPQGGCGFIAGIPKSMKSWLALDLAISLTSEVEFLDRAPAKAVNVMYIQQEDPVSLVLARHVVIASSKAPQQTPGSSVSASNAALYMIVQSGFSGTDMGWQAWLDEKIAQHDIGLVIMDTLSTVASTDTDSARDIKSGILDPIKTIARQHNCAMLFVHHMTKAGANSRAGQNMAGSGQIHAWADFGIYVTDKTNDNKITFDAETKYTGTQRMTFKIAGLPDAYSTEYQVQADDAILTNQIVENEDGTVPVKSLADKPLPPMFQQSADKRKANVAHTRELLLKHPDIGVTTLAQKVGVSTRTMATYMKAIRGEGK